MTSLHRSSNGVKEMRGFREYFNLSRSEEDNSTTGCTADDSSGETSAILVSTVNCINEHSSWRLLMPLGMLCFTQQ